MWMVESLGVKMPRWAGGGGGARHERLEVGERAHVGWNRHRPPGRHLGPDEERHTRVEAFGYPHGAIRPDPGKRGPAVGDRHLAAQLLDRTDSGKGRRLRERAQIERRGELAVHDGLALRADEAKVVARSL